MLQATVRIRVKSRQADITFVEDIPLGVLTKEQLTLTHMTDRVQDVVIKEVGALAQGGRIQFKVTKFSNIGVSNGQAKDNNDQVQGVQKLCSLQRFADRAKSYCLKYLPV